MSEETAAAVLVQAMVDNSDALQALMVEAKISNSPAATAEFIEPFYAAMFRMVQKTRRELGH